MSILGLLPKFIPASQDSWTSMIDNPFRHPDKVGHAVAHLFVTGFWLWITHGDPVALLVDLWINAQVEVMDGTRPRRHLTLSPAVFENQVEYDNATIDGFSFKDFVAGVAGSLVAFVVFRLFLM